MFNYDELKNDITALSLTNSISDEIANIKNAALDDAIGFVPFGNTLVTLVKGVCDIPSMIFWSKMELYLNGISELSFEDRQKFSEKFANEEYKDFITRMIMLVDKIDDNRKAEIHANLTRALMQELLDIDTFFRLESIVNNIVYEDLIFLENNIRKHNLEYSVNIISLVNNSLAYQSVISANGDNEYEISSLGLNLFLFGLKYNEYDLHRDIRERVSDKAPEIQVTSHATFA